MSIISQVFGISSLLVLGSLLVLLGTMVFLLMIIRPIVAAIGVLSFAFVNTSLFPILIKFGGLSIRYVDIFSVLLILVVFLRFAMQRDLAILLISREFFLPPLLFLLYIGVSLVHVGFSLPDDFAISMVSYLRLITTALFAPLLYLAIQDERDMQVFQRLLIVCSAISVAIGVWEGPSSLGVEDILWSAERASGLLGPNTLGLVSGLLAVYGLVKRDQRSRSVLWVIPLVCGILGLVLTKSTSSILATLGATAVYIAAMRSSRRRILGLFRWAAIGMAMTITVALAVWTLRQSDIVGLSSLSGGSFAQRLMLAYAGLKIFFDHPFFGVGWQASGTQAFLGSPALQALLMARFSELPEHYFLLGGSTTAPQLHNMYIQFLAELGVTGFILFTYVCFRLGKVIVRLLRSLPARSPYSVWAQFCALGLVFLLIWWNTNPLYGGQTESFLAFTFLGSLAAVARLAKLGRAHSTLAVRDQAVAIPQLRTN